MDIYRSTKVIHSQILNYMLRGKFARVLKTLSLRNCPAKNKGGQTIHQLIRLALGCGRVTMALPGMPPPS